MTVTYERDSRVGVITIDRPPVNAYDQLLHWELDQCWQRAADDDDARVIVLQARGKHFCAGADISGGGRPAPDGANVRSPPEGLEFVRNLMKPTIAAVQGGCVGGGQRMVFPCDLLFCSEDAFFLAPLVKMGIGGIQAPLHVWRYGERVAKEMLFAGTRVPATRLHEMGSVNRFFPADRLHA